MCLLCQVGKVCCQRKKHYSERQPALIKIYVNSPSQKVRVFI